VFLAAHVPVALQDDMLAHYPDDAVQDIMAWPYLGQHGVAHSEL
jgi:hypothetical protein